MRTIGERLSRTPTKSKNRRIYYDLQPNPETQAITICDILIHRVVCAGGSKGYSYLRDISRLYGGSAGCPAPEALRLADHRSKAAVGPHPQLTCEPCV